MKRILFALVLSVALVSPGCADKILAARTGAAFVEIARQTVKLAFASVGVAKRAECTAKDATRGDVYKECMKKTLEAEAFFLKMEPQILEAQKVLWASITAAESGKSQDLISALMKGVCLLTKCAVWLPEEWKLKIASVLALAGSFTCEKTAYQRMPLVDQIALSKRVNRLLLLVLRQRQTT